MLTALATCFVLSSPCANGLRIESDGMDVYRRGVVVDSDIMGGVSRDKEYLTRMRLGLLFVKEPWFFSAGFSTTVLDLTRKEILFGPEIELLNLWRGVWIHGGLGWDGLKKVEPYVGAGFSLLGVEYINRTFFLTLRAPIGILVLL